MAFWIKLGITGRILFVIMCLAGVVLDKEYPNAKWQILGGVLAFYGLVTILVLVIKPEIFKKVDN